MKKLAKKIEKLMMAITFAEAGDEKTAREIMKEDKRDEKQDRVTPERPRKGVRV